MTSRRRMRGWFGVVEHSPQPAVADRPGGNRIAQEVGSRKRAFQLARSDWHRAPLKEDSVIRKFRITTPSSPRYSIAFSIRKTT